MKKRLLPTLLALAMALTLLPATALAAGEISVTVTPTNIRADSVINSEGYGSLKIKGTWDEYDPWDLWGDKRPEGVVNPQIALVDRNGTLLFPYRENDDKYARDIYYHYSDGIVSFAHGAYMEEGYPEYYRLDGTKAFPLNESTREETRYDTVYQITSTYVGGVMSGGYALVADVEVENESGSTLSYSHPTTRKIIDKNGNVTCVLPEAYTDPVMGSIVEYSCNMNLKDLCGEGLFAIMPLGGYALGYMDVNGKIAINLDGRGFTDLGSFTSGLAWVVHEDGGCGYIDKTGKLVIPCLYDTASLCSSDGMCAVSIDGKYGYIDKTGATVIPFEYDNAYGAGAGLASVIKNGKCGLVDYNNNVVVPLEYDDITCCEGGVSYAVKDGLLYIITWDDPSGSTPAEPEQPAAPSTPSTPSTPAGPMPEVVLSPQKLSVDGEDVRCEKYNIGGSNYFKLRDLAYALNGTGSQFGVGFDEATATVSITTGAAYEPIGTEMATGVDNSATAQPSSQSILIDGEAHAELTVYNIGGSNFFQLRELGNVLGFTVDFDADTNTAVVLSTQE